MDFQCVFRECTKITSPWSLTKISHKIPSYTSPWWPQCQNPKFVGFIQKPMLVTVQTDGHGRGRFKDQNNIYNIKYTMYPWRLQANLFMGGQCTFSIDLCNTVNEWRWCTGPTNKLRNILGVLRNVISVLRNVPGVLRNVISVLRNVPGVLHIHPSEPRVSGNGFFLTYWPTYLTYDLDFLGRPRSHPDRPLCKIVWL